MQPQPVVSGESGEYGVPVQLLHHRPHKQPGAGEDQKYNNRAVLTNIHRDCPRRQLQRKQPKVQADYSP